MTERYINPYTDFGFKKQAEIARFTPQDAKEYEESVKVYRDLTNVVNTAERKGREEANREAARRMKADGLPTEIINKYTGLSPEEIEVL